MWQLYAQTAFDIVAERQREARKAVLDRHAAAMPSTEQGSGDRARLFAARMIALLGRTAGALADASLALAARLEGGRGNA